MGLAEFRPSHDSELVSVRLMMGVYEVSISARWGRGGEEWNKGGCKGGRQANLLCICLCNKTCWYLVSRLYLCVIHDHLPARRPNHCLISTVAMAPTVVCHPQNFRGHHLAPTSSSRSSLMPLTSWRPVRTLRHRVSHNIPLLCHHNCVTYSDTA